MTTESQLCNLAGCVIDGIKEAGEELSILAHCERVVANCPTCGKKSTRIHSYYIRRPRDLPIGDRRVRLKLRVRRYRCLNSACPSQTFAERIPELLPVYAQRTTRLTKTLYRIGQALGGQAGSRLLGALYLSASPDTMLRILRQSFKPVDTIPEVLGVDDWAMRKGTTYGTILVDLERRQPVDLLPDRQASTLATWLNVHPGVKVIVRDRSREYMRGAAAGAPTAVQVADRWHLLKNLRQMLERLLHQLHRTLSQLPIKQFSTDVQRRSEPFGRSSTECAQSQESKKRRLSQYAEVQRLRRSGSNISQIARQLRLARGTVRRYFYAESFPERTRHPIAPSILDPYLPFLRQRIDDGCTNAQALWREIRSQGFRGSRDPVARWVQQQRQQPAPTTPTKYLATLRLASSK